MSRLTFRGFCYDTCSPLDLTRAQWQQRADLLIAAGGTLRVESGSTFAHGLDSQLRFDVGTVLDTRPTAERTKAPQDEALTLEANVHNSAYEVRRLERQLAIARGTHAAAIAERDAHRTLQAEAA